MKEDYFIVVSVLLAITFSFGMWIGNTVSENGWRKDCSKLHAHVSTEGHVFMCAPRTLEVRNETTRL